MLLVYRVVMAASATTTSERPMLPPRIALISPGFSASDADWCIPAVARLVRALAAGADVEVFALRYPHTSTPYQAFGARVHPFGFRGGGVVRLALLLRAGARIARAGRDRPFSVIHGLWADESGYLATRAAASLRVGAVVSLMGGELVHLGDIRYGTQRSRAGRTLVRRALRRAEITTVGSLFLRRLAAPFVPPERLRELPLGVDTETFTPAGETEPLAGRPVLLHAGSLTPVKDQRTLLLAFARVAAALPEACLHVAGEGPLRGELERLARELGVAAQVRFHGEVRHERLPSYYRAADLVVASSRYESQGMVAVEAAACGRLTVGTAVGVLPELHPDIPHAHPGDARSLADAVVQMLAHPERRQALAEQSLTTVRERFSLAATVATLRRLYGEAAAARGAAPAATGLPHEYGSAGGI